MCSSDLDKEVEQSQRLLDQQTAAQSKLMKQSKDQQLAMWNETNYGAQTAHLQAAGLNPALMHGAGGGGGSTTAGSGTGGQATASGAGKQQLLHDRTTPIDIAQITVAAAQAKKLEAEMSVKALMNSILVGNSQIKLNNQQAEAITDKVMQDWQSVAQQWNKLQQSGQSIEIDRERMENEAKKIFMIS